MVLLAQQLQPIIDKLAAEGANKIIVMSHLQVRRCMHTYTQSLWDARWEV
jgi:hypothetical protein